MKVTKKLVAAIVCFVFSVALCLVACYAWFTSNSSVNANHISTAVDGSSADIAVKAYFLSESRNISNGSLTYTVTNRHVNDNGDTVLNGAETMLKYNTDPLSSTALLLEIDCYSKTVGSYYISVATQTTVFNADKNSETSDGALYKGYLSNVVHFNRMDDTATNVEGMLSCSLGIGAAQYSLVRGTSVIRDNPVKLITFTESDKQENGYYKQTHYLLMDYDDAHISDLYDKISQNDQSLKEISFDSDVIIKLTEGSAELQPDPDNSVQTVIDFINEIGTVTADSGSRIALARNAYESLSDDQKAMVTNYGVLTAAEEAFSQFAVEDFLAQYNALAALTPELTTAYENAIAAAETAYGNLTAAQKQEVATQYSAVQAKRAEYNTMLQNSRDEAAANAAIAKIDAIGAVTANSGSAINAARAAYDGLTAAQKALVPTAKLNALTAAEEEFNRINSTVTTVTLDRTTASLTVGDTTTLKVTASPSGAVQSTSWSSGTTSVATVDGSGKVTAKAEGTAIITVTVTDKAGNTKTATCTVTVTDAAVSVTSVTLNTTKESLVVGDTLELIATINPANATIKEIAWTSSNETKATVTPNANDNTRATVTAVGKTDAGANITVTVTDANGNTKSATCNVPVANKPASTVAVTGVTLDKDTASVAVGGNVTLNATVAPSGATNKTVSWSSDNTSVATVSGGVVTGVAAGTATITVTTEDGGFTATCTVTVTGGGTVDPTPSGESTITWDAATDYKTSKTLNLTDDKNRISITSTAKFKSKTVGSNTNGLESQTSGQGFTVTANSACIVKLTVACGDASKNLDFTYTDADGEHTANTGSTGVVEITLRLAKGGSCEITVSATNSTANKKITLFAVSVTEA